MKRSIAKSVLMGAAVAIAALFCNVSTALAADDNWHFSITPYLWLPSVNTQIAVKDQPIEVQTDTQSQDILRKLDFAMLVTGEVARGKFGLIYDAEALKLSDDGTVNIGEPRDFDTSVSFAEGELAAEYRLVDEPEFSLDALAGARVLWAKLVIDIDPSSTAPQRKGDQSKTWFDPIIGMKCRYRIAEKWAASAYGDVGGWGVGSTLTYQLLGTVSYSFNSHIELQAGYRYFFDKFSDGPFTFNAKLYGPVVGLTFNF